MSYLDINLNIYLWISVRFLPIRNFKWFLTKLSLDSKYFTILPLALENLYELDIQAFVFCKKISNVKNKSLIVTLSYSLVHKTFPQIIKNCTDLNLLGFGNVHSEKEDDTYTTTTY